MSTWQAVNTWITFVLAIAVVVVLAVTLILTLAALRKARRHAEALASGLEMVVQNTASVPQQLSTINGALVRLLEGLRSVDAHITAAGRTFGL